MAEDDEFESYKDKFTFAMSISVRQSFLDRIDDTWPGDGFSSRSEFIKYCIRKYLDEVRKNESNNDKPERTTH